MSEYSRINVDIIIFSEVKMVGIKKPDLVLTVCNGENPSYVTSFVSFQSERSIDTNNWTADFDKAGKNVTKHNKSTGYCVFSFTHITGVHFWLP